MSFDLFLTHFRHDEAAELNRSDIDEILALYAVSREPNFMRLEFPDGGQAEVYVGDASDNTTVMLTHFGGAEGYALRHSKNYGASRQIKWIIRGWNDAVAGRWK